MGCGKSSVGRKLSALLSCSYTDLDTYIEKKQGMSIPEIFDTEGEAAFRKMELKALSEIVESASLEKDGNAMHILSLGGGTIMTAECADIIHNQTVCIYIRASVDTLTNHLEKEAEGRPMLKSSTDRNISLRGRIEELMDARAETYEKTAQIIIDSDGKEVDEIALEIISSRHVHAYP